MKLIDEDAIIFDSFDEYLAKMFADLEAKNADLDVDELLIENYRLKNIIEVLKLKIDRSDLRTHQESLGRRWDCGYCKRDN